MADITEIAVASWRLEKWLDNVNVERKMAAKSSLRAIKKYLSESNIEIIDLTGANFDVGLAVSVVNNESDETDEDKLIISEMVKPIIKENGAVIQYGQVILGDEVRKPKENNVVEPSPRDVQVVTEEVVEIAKEIEQHTDTLLAEKLDSDKKTNKPRMKAIIAGIFLVLQLMIIILLIGMWNRLELPQTISNPDEKTEIVIQDNSAELAEIIEKIDNLNNRLDSVEDSINQLENNVTTDFETVKQNIKESTNGDTIEDNYNIYIVQHGDTLIKICEDNNINYYTDKAIILNLNHIDDPNALNEGQKILLPKQ